MPLSDYLVGLGFLGLTLVAAALAATFVVRRRLQHLDVTLSALAWGLVATAAVVFSHLVPLALGVLSRWTVLAAALLTAAGAARLPRKAAPGPPDALPVAAPSPPAARWVAAILWLVVAGWIVAWLRPRATTPIDGTDMLTFDLPIMGTWVQDGTVWQVVDFQPLQPHGAYPHNGDLVLLSTVLPWKSDVLIRFALVPFLVMLAAATYALARELGATAAAALGVGAVAVTLPVVLSTTLYQGVPDAVLWATFSTGALFLVRSRRTGMRADLVLAGLGLGLAFGTKWYGPPAVAVVLAVWGASLLLDRRALRAVARESAIVLAIIAVAGGFWLVRNAIEYGSPLFPSPLAPLGFDTPDDPLREQLDHKVAEYLTDGAVVGDYVWPAFRERFGAGGLFVPLALLAGLVALARRPNDTVNAPVAVVAASTLIVVVYALLPYSALGPEGSPINMGANTRYALPGLFLAIAGLAALVARGRIGEAVVLTLAAVSVLDGLRRPPLDPGGGRILLWGALIALVAAASRALWRRRETLRSWPRPAVVAAALVLLVGVAGGGYRAQQSFHEKRYRDDPTFSWIAENAPSGRRVATAGRWSLVGPPPTWPMYGPRIRNEVRHLARTSEGQTLAYDEYGDWRRAVAAFDLVLMGRWPSREVGWAERAGFKPVAQSPRFTLYATGR
jgi:hypothetical protein